MAALGPTVLLGTASGLIISNAWAVASDRAVKAGAPGGGGWVVFTRAGAAGAAPTPSAPAGASPGCQRCPHTSGAPRKPACRPAPLTTAPARPAGKLLAHLLLSGAHGDRPVRLVAHGMGARLVFHCLLELCRQGARGVVQHCVLLGCPVRGGGAGAQGGRQAVEGEAAGEAGCG